MLKKLPVSYVESRYSGDFATKVTKDFNDAIQITGYPFVGYKQPLAMFITIVGISCIIFFTNWIFRNYFLGVRAIKFVSR